jgi:RNA polymerase sigma factor (sigma-70 family)
MQRRDGGKQSESTDAALFERYAASIFAYARLYTPSWEDAEDVVLEVFTEAWAQNNLTWLAEKQQLVWLRRVAQHKMVDRYRRSAHVALLPFDQVIESVRVAEGLSPEQIVLRQEELEGLHIAIRQLSLLQQQVLQLRVWNGLRFREIAGLLNKREAAVRKIYSRTLAQLRSIYERR